MSKRKKLSPEERLLKILEDWVREKARKDGEDEARAIRRFWREIKAKHRRRMVERHGTNGQGVAKI